MNRHYTNYKSMVKTTFAVVFIAFFCGSITAQTNYNGPNGGSWHVEANWSAGLPGPGNNANIFGSSTVNVDQSLTIDFTITAFGNINFNAPVVNNGSVLPSGTTNINNTFTNNGSYTNQGGTTTIAANGNVINIEGGTFRAQNGSIINNSIITNGGQLTISTQLDNNGAIVNYGTTLVQGTLNNNGSFTSEGGSTLDVSGTGANFNNLTNADLDLKSGSTTSLLVGGNLTNASTVSNAGTFSNDGTLNNNSLFNNNNGGLFSTKRNFANQATFNNNNNATFRVEIQFSFVTENFGDFTNNGTFENIGNLINKAGGTFTNNGSMSQTSGASTLIDNLGVFTNTGSILTNGTFNNQSTFTNNGTLTATNGGNLTNTGTLINNNIITNLQTIVNNGTIINDGRFENDSPGTLTNNDQLVNQLGGFISNDFDLTNNSYLQNIGRIENGVRVYNYGTFDNNGILDNLGCFNNHPTGTLNNDKLNGIGGVVNNFDGGYFKNEGIFNNTNEVFIFECSSLVNTSGATINNYYWFTITGIFWNTGIVNNFDQGGIFYNGFSVPPSPQNPELICENITASVDANGEARILGSSVAKSTLDNCAAFILTVDNENELTFTCADIGPNTVTLKLVHKEQEATCDAVVTVIDNSNPTITCPADIVKVAQNGSATATWTNTTTDNCSSTLTCTHASGSSFPLGMTTVTCTAVDPSGNTNECSFKVTVVPEGDCADVVSIRKVLNSHLNCGSGNPYVLWLEGGVYYTAGDDLIFVEYTDGTALFTGSVYRNGQRGYVDVMYSGFTANPPAGSPKTSSCVSQGNSDWRYYPTMMGTFTMENGVVCDLTRRGPAFQTGTGANLNENNTVGGSGWFDTNENTVGDFNFNLSASINCYNSQWLEAECADNVGSRWTVSNDGSASNGQALVPPAGSYSYNTPPTSSSDLLTYTVGVSEAGKYRLYIRSVAPNGSSDSYWVQVNNGSWTKWNTVNNDNYSSAYQWDIVGHWNGSASWDVPQTFQLNPGSNTIKISWREPGTKLDKIMVTLVSKEPTGLGETATNCGNGGGNNGGGDPPAEECNKTALFVAGSTYLNSSDSQIKQRLEGYGYDVTVKDDDNVYTSDSNGKGLIIISSTTSSGKVNTKFRDVAIPVVVWEQWLFDDMKMTGTGSNSNYGRWCCDNDVDILDPNHPITAGFSGEIDILTTDKNIGWGKPSSEAAKLASVDDIEEKVALFAYETGANMVGKVAPARRVGMFMVNSTANCFNNAGWLLFDSVIEWAADCELGVGSRANDVLALQAQATNDRKVDLFWTNNTGYKNEFMILERSTDGENFEVLSERYAYEEENQNLQFFEETDATPVIGTNYYRVKVIHLDGTFTTSPIQVIEFVDLIDFALYPNPTTDFVEVNMESLMGTENVTIRIFDWMGRTVQQEEIDEVTTYTHRIDLRDFRTGQYSLSVFTEGKRPVSRKLIIAK